MNREELLKQRDKLQKENEQLQEDLSRKTQEYEDLKFCTEILSFKYKKCYSILEKIEAVCRADTYTFADGTQIRYDSLDDILDIISEAKDIYVPHKKDARKIMGKRNIR